MCIETNELPVEDIGDGEGTFIAGTPNPHLSLESANGCIIARAYLVAAFTQLSSADQQGWLEAQDIRRLTVLGTQLIAQMDRMDGIIAFASASVGPDEVYNFLNVTHEYIEANMGGDQVAFLAMVQAFADENEFEG